MPASTTLLYLLGTGRSGSTLVANVLGEAHGAFAAGEVRFVWRRGLVEDRLCGCGATFSTCPLWQSVMRAADVRSDPMALAEMGDELVRIRHLPSLLAGRGLDAAKSPGVSDYLAHVRRLYAAIGVVTGARVIIDSSKSPAYALVLEAAGVGSVRHLHLVRDPRACAFSWSRERASAALPDDDEPMDRFPARKSALLWLLWHSVASKRFARTDGFTRLRYEDFVEDPRESLAAVLGGVGLDLSSASVHDHSFVFGHNHCVAGNPSRRRRGSTVIGADDEWRWALRPASRRLVTCIDAPLMRQFGYPLRFDGAAAAAAASHSDRHAHSADSG